MDRIDIQVEVPAVPHNVLMQKADEESSKTIRKRVTQARKIQTKRFIKTKVYTNSRMSSRLIKKHCQIKPDSEKLLETAIQRFGLSARAYNRILKISRTIADLDAQTDIQIDHISEAIQYRSLDRKKSF